MINAVQLHDKFFEPFIREDQIRNRVAELGKEITAEYSGKNPLLIGVLNGSVIFMSDLLRHIDTPCEIGFIRVSSYTGTESTGKVRQLLGMDENAEGRDIILVEDIIDTGETAEYLLNEFNKKNPKSIAFATMLFKPASLKRPIKPEYTGFEIPPAFVVGYGLDYDGLGRNLPGIYQLKEN